MHISVIRPSELAVEEISAWHSMQIKTESLLNPFLCPEFAIAVDSFQPNARVAVLVDGSEIVGFFPFQRRRFGVGVPIGVGLNDCQGVIHAPDVEWDPKELLRACKISTWQFDHLVEGQKPFERHAATAASSPVIDLAEGFTAYWENLRISSPKFCRNVVRRVRKLEREVGNLRFIMDSRDLTGLRILMRWKSEQYRRTGWVDRFERPWVVDLVDYLFTTHNELFGGLLSLLYAGDTLVAAHFGLRAGPVLAAWFPAYDTHFGSQSPGLISHVRMSEEAATVGVHLINFGKGAEPYKETLKNRYLFVAEGMVVQGTLPRAAHRLRSDMVRWIGPRIRENQLLFRAANQLLKRYDRIG
jgi:CelD/BcsL family acetyltransferase involved in cellulose biosynthesis